MPMDFDGKLMRDLKILALGDSTLAKWYLICNGGKESSLMFIKYVYRTSNSV
jgi:hypothetical protein